MNKILGNKNFVRLCITLFLGVVASGEGYLQGQNNRYGGIAQENDSRKEHQKMAFFMQAVDYAYVDTVSLAPLVEKGIVEMLEDLDPHSAYISAKDVEKANEPLVGNFDGIGVSFQVIKDTIVIVDVIAGGPSEKLGIQSGDKIVRIDSLNATGDSAKTDFVFRNLRGVKGTTVSVGILRKGINREMDYKIVRDKIPLNSVDAYFMVDKKTAYILLNRFARTTMDEIRQAIADLKTQGMEQLILDLRGNSGGYLDVAVDLADEFLSADKVVTYIDGKAQARYDFKSTSKGGFEKGRMLVLIDEGSASASEIVSGALQDWDRALIVGRRSFGKGLVQRPMDMPDKSQIRLTIARYYTPSGRCIQKPYTEGTDDYYSDISNRYKHGEMWNMDSIKLPDSLKFKSASGRLVYGGGGIMPDVFVPLDTQRVSDYYIDLRRKNILNQFAIDRVNENRKYWNDTYPSFDDFKNNFVVDDAVMERFYKFAEKEGVSHKNFKTEKAELFLQDMLTEMKKDTTLSQSATYSQYMEKVLWSTQKMEEYLKEKATKEDSLQAKASENTDVFLRAQIKALLARNLYGMPYYYRIIKEVDDAFLKGMELLNDKKLYDKLHIQN